MKEKAMTEDEKLAFNELGKLFAESSINIPYNITMSSTIFAIHAAILTGSMAGGTNGVLCVSGIVLGNFIRRRKIYNLYRQGLAEFVDRQWDKISQISSIKNIIDIENASPWVFMNDNKRPSTKFWPADLRKDLHRSAITTGVKASLPGQIYSAARHCLGG